MRDLLLHIPHSSKEIPDEFIGDYFDVSELNETLLKLTDTFTTEIFSIAGIEKIIFPYSRAFCDVERFVMNEPMEIKFGHGFYYTHGVNSNPFRHTVNKDVVLNEFYKPHHDKLCRAVKEMNNPLIIDCHSFSNEIYPTTPFRETILPDFMIGNNGKKYEIEISEMIHSYLSDLGFQVNINYPYSGSMSVSGCDSVMIEINKKLYLSTDLLSKRSDFYKIEKIIKKILEMLC